VSKYNQVYRRIVPHSTLRPVGDGYYCIDNVDNRHIKLALRHPIVYDAKRNHKKLDEHLHSI